MTLYLEHVTRKFGNTQALTDVDLTIRTGEFLAILGPSGCGKTTLLRIIGGFMEPTSGVVRLDEEVYSDSTHMVPVEQRDLGMVFQSFALWPHMTVRQHVEFPLKSSRHKAMTQQEKKDAVDTALENMGLTALANRYPDELSGGQRQRVSLARAMVSKPSILLMDEPLSALDAELKISMRKVIMDIHHLTGATIIYVTHDQSEALAMADRILVMRSGHIEQLGTPQEIYTHPQTEFTATFVSKCNLIKGQWRPQGFKVEDYPLVYKDSQVAPIFKQKGLYPIRPEQFRISRTEQGLPATITNRQYNGREIQYSLLQNGEQIRVYTDCREIYNPGEQVQLVFSA